MKDKVCLAGTNKIKRRLGRWKTCSPRSNISGEFRMIITVGTPPVEVELSSRVRELCPLLRSILPLSSLPKVHITAFRLVLSYLDGDHDLTQFTALAHNTTLLLRFAQAWSLAGKMKLPRTQDKLVSTMADVYNHSLDNGTQYPADDNLLESFRHLRDECGNDSQAEKFLLTFVARTASAITSLKAQLQHREFDQELQNDFLAEARSLQSDSIKYLRSRFLVDIDSPPRYKPLDIDSPPGYEPLDINVRPVCLHNPGFIPPQVPFARDEGRPIPNVPASHQHRTYQATIHTPLNMTFTTGDDRSANVPGPTQTGGGTRSVSRPPPRIPNAEATARANAGLGTSPPRPRHQEEATRATSAGANAPNDDREPTDTPPRNTSSSQGAHNTSVPANNLAAARQIVANAPLLPPRHEEPVTNLYARPSSLHGETPQANTSTHTGRPQHTSFVSRIFDFFGRSRRPATPIPCHPINNGRRPHYHRHRYCQVYPGAAGIHIRYRDGDGDDGGSPPPPRGGIRFASPDPSLERRRGGGGGGSPNRERRGGGEGDSPEPRRGGGSVRHGGGGGGDDAPSSPEPRSGRRSDAYRYKDVADMEVMAWRPKKRGSRTKVSFERRRYDE
jgi:hypothetical protein